MQFVSTVSSFLHIMIRHNVDFCKNEPRFMPLIIFHLICILLLMMKMNKKQFLFHSWKIRAEGRSPLTLFSLIKEDRRMGKGTFRTKIIIICKKTKKTTIFQNVGDQPQSCYCLVLYVRAGGISQAEKKNVIFQNVLGLLHCKWVSVLCRNIHAWNMFPIYPCTSHFLYHVWWNPW